MALKRVDLPTLGRPTMPARRLMLIFALRPEEYRRAPPLPTTPPTPRLRCQRRSSAEEAREEGNGKGVVAGTAGVRVNPTNAEPRARDIVAMGTRRRRSRREEAEAYGERHTRD